ncbi:MAG: hypothetical protein NTV22_09230, partial [bacterium]|nr:hypothetical protein [bacterium]
MNARTTTLCLTLCCTALLTFGAYWTEKAQNPSWFPYKTGTGNTRWMDLPIPTPSQSDPTMPAIVSPYDAFKDVQGYWPLYYSVGCFANGKFYVGCGLGPQVSWGTPGYAWPSNSYGNGYSYNRQSGFAIYNPQDNTWDCAKWDESGPVAFNYVTWGVGNVQGGGSKMPECSDGTQIGSTQSFAYDWDNDGTDEIFLHAGYPHWDGNNFIYDPDSDTWTNSAAAANFSSGDRAQYYGGTVRVDSNIYAIGGGFWGPAGKTHMQIYSPQGNSWTVHENLYDVQLTQFGIGAIGKKIYMLGGLPVRDNVYMLDTDNIAAGITNIGKLTVGVARPSVVQWRGLLYVVAGEITGGALTNLFQVFNPATAATTVNNVALPLNAYAASCAVDTNGTFYFGGAMRYTEVNGTNYNSSRLWSAPLPQQDVLVSPSTLNFWQTNTTLQLRLDNVAFVPMVCSNTPSVAWLSVANVVTVPNQSNIIVEVTVDRGMYAGPTNGSISIRYSGGTITVPVLADTPRPVAVLVPTSTITLQPRNKSFVLGNSGVVAMSFTNTSAQAFITDITPGLGVLAPGESTSVSFTVTAAAPRPGVATIQVAFNSYNGVAGVFTINNFPADYYVSTSGNNANDGLSWPTAWRNIAFGVTNIPNGSADEGAVTLNVAAGTYAGESTDASGTNWIIDLSNR